MKTTTLNAVRLSFILPALITGIVVGLLVYFYFLAASSAQSQVEDLFVSPSIISADFDLNDFPDIAVSTSEGVKIYLNDGSGGFELSCILETGEAF